MESTHETTKDWQIKEESSRSPQPSVHSPPLEEIHISNNDSNSNRTSPQVNNSYSPTPNFAHPQQHYPYPPNIPMHPPLHPYPQQEQQSPAPGFMTNKEESDPKLPGLMVLSQPGTPRPNSAKPDTNAAKKTRHPYYSSFSSTPYPMMPHKRSRNDALFATETGPSFSAAKPLDNLYSSDRTRLLTVRVQSKMDRGFFLAENDWTCYRRNYFQVSSTFGIHGINVHPFYGDQDLNCFVQTAQHGLQPVSRFLLGITARVSNSDKPIELIQHTPKRDKGPQMTPVAKHISPGGNLSLSSVGNTQNIATFERIQFKTATANNGKRRAAQQYYVVVIDLYAETQPGELTLVGSSISSPLVVRGRSPGHYADSHDRSSTSITTEPINQNELYYQRQQQQPLASPMMPPYGPPSSSYGYYPPYPNGPFPPGMMVSSPHPTGPYLVHSMSDPSSSESSSPDLYQAPDYHHPSIDKHPPLQIHSLPMDPAGDWSRSRYHSAGSVPSPEHHASYFQNHYTSTGAPPTPTTPFSSRKYDTIAPTDHSQASS